MDSQAEGEKPVVEPPNDDVSPMSENVLKDIVEDSQTLVIGPPPEAPPPPPPPPPPPAPPPAPAPGPPLINRVKRPVENPLEGFREQPRKVLIRNRIPFTSEKFNLVGYASKVLYGAEQIYVPYTFRCDFVCKDKRGYATRGYATHFLTTDSHPTPEAMLKEDNSEYPGILKKVRKEGRPVFGLLRLVWPSPTHKEIHHIIPYFVNGPKAKPTIWFLEQYDTTFWWLFNGNKENPNVAPRNWHNVVGKAMIGEGKYIRAYVEAAAKLGEKRTYKDGVAVGLEGYLTDLQRSSKGVSAETCVPWSMVILKYLMDPKTIGVDKPRLDLETTGQDKFDEMYGILNDKRDSVLMWVQGTVAGGKRRTRRRRRRQTGRKSKRSRK